MYSEFFLAYFFFRNSSSGVPPEIRVEVSPGLSPKVSLGISTEIVWDSFFYLFFVEILPEHFLVMLQKYLLRFSNGDVLDL